MKLGEKILLTRKKQAMSQEALADKIGVSRQAVSKWETGESEPEVSKLRALAEVLGVTADWLLDETEPADDVSPEACSSEETGAMQRTWVDALPKTLRTLIHQYGWLCGLRLAVSGALFVAMGLVGRAMMRSMESMSGGFPGFSSPDVFVDEMGRVISRRASNPFEIMTGFIIVIGVIALLGGIVLATMLKKKE